MIIIGSIIAIFIRTLDGLQLHRYVSYHFIKSSNYGMVCREKGEKALWFAETYGLVPKSLKMEDKTGAQINVTLAGDYNSGNCNTCYILCVA